VISRASGEVPDPLVWDGRYLLRRPISFGRHADLALATDVLRGMDVVLKRLRGEAIDALPLFLREYRIHRQLSHPSIPRALELGFTRDGERLCPYFTTALAPGRALDEWVRDGAFHAVDLHDVALDLLRALDHVHRQGFVHADVSPLNVVVGERAGRMGCQLLDFGLAMPRNRPVGDALWQRPYFAAPELLAGALVDARTDLYAAGRTLALLVETARSATGSLDPRLEPLLRLIDQCAASAPADRPPTAAAAILRLEPSSAIEPPEAFASRLLAVPLPWRERFESFARELCTAQPDDLGAIVVEIPGGLPTGRLLGAAMDEAAARRARVLPILNARNPEAEEAFERVMTRLEPQRGERDGWVDADASEAGDEAPDPGAYGATVEADGAQAEAGADAPAVEGPVSAGEGERLLFVVIEDLGRMTAQGLEHLLKRWGSHVRILALEEAHHSHRVEGADGSRWPEVAEVAEGSEGSRWPEVAEGSEGFGWAEGPYGPQGRRPGRARRVRVAPWDGAEARRWLQRALGRIGAPWERAQEPLVAPSPRTLIEALADRVRAGRLERVGEGYVWRDGQEAAHGAEVHHCGAPEPPQSLLERLGCVKWPIPRDALVEFAGSALDELADCFARGVLIESPPRLVVAQALRESPSNPPTPEEFARLADILERHDAEPAEVARIWGEAGRSADAIRCYVRAAREASHAKASAHIESAQALLEERGGTDRVNEGLRAEVLLAGGRAHRLAGRGEASARSLDALVALSLSSSDSRPDLEKEVVHERYALALALERWGEAVGWARRWHLLERRPEAVSRIHLARALAWRAEGLPGAALGELDAAMGAFERHGHASPSYAPGGGESAAAMGAFERHGHAPLTMSRGPNVDPVVGAEGPAEVALIGRERAALETDLLAAWEGSERSTRSRGARAFTPERAAARPGALMFGVAARLARFTGRIDAALGLLAQAEREPLDSLGDELDLQLEQGACAFELGDLGAALERVEDVLALGEGRSCWPSKRVEAVTLKAQLIARLDSPESAALLCAEPPGLASTHPAALDYRLLRLELELATGGGAGGVQKAALSLGHALARRLHHRRAARAFRLAAEAAIAGACAGPATEFARLAAHALHAVEPAYATRPFHLLTAARALSHDLRLEEAEVRHAEARQSLLSLSLRIDDTATRERWLGHPDQRALAEASSGSGEATSPSGPVPLRF
jgi:tetratricopeptide (TPR) repeat protein